MLKLDVIRFLQPGTMIEGTTIIGEGCTIGPNSQIVDSVIGDRTTIHSSVVQESNIGSDTAVGPFAHIRPESNLGQSCKNRKLR